MVWVMIETEYVVNKASSKLLKIYIFVNVVYR